MASKVVAPSRALLEALSPIREQTIRECSKIAHTTRRNVLRQCRKISTATVQRSEMDVNKAERPRWAQTPAAMTAPYPTKARPAGWAPFKCNSSPQKLDEIYTNFLGPNGSKMLSEETKWLAVTHKSFDHGRRGFNDRLAFLGKRIMDLQTSLSLLASMDASKYMGSRSADPHGRVPFPHPATANVEVLLGNAKFYLMHHKQISRVAEQFSIPSIVRWSPKNPENLAASGSDMVYTQAVFAIIGALAMEQGGAVANKIVRERVIQRMSVQKGIEGMSADAEADADII